MPMFDSSPAFTPGLCFWLPGPIRLQGTPPDADEVSRFSRVQFLDVRMALGLRRACRKLTLSLPPVWPSRWEHSVGARNSFFAARFLARRCLGLRFARHLAAPGARLEVKMVRYSFLVGLFHPQLHAGLSRRLRSHTIAARKHAHPNDPPPPHGCTLATTHRSHTIAARKHPHPNDPPLPPGCTLATTHRS